MLGSTKDIYPVCEDVMMIATKNQALDRVLSQFPGLEQADAVEDAQFIRFTVELRHNREDHDCPPQIFLLFTQSEFALLRADTALLEAAFRGRLQRTEFKDGSNGSLVRTAVNQDRGVWAAITVDGSTWEFDRAKNYGARQAVSFSLREAAGQFIPA